MQSYSTKPPAQASTSWPENPWSVLLVSRARCFSVLILGPELVDKHELEKKCLKQQIKRLRPVDGFVELLFSFLCLLSLVKLISEWFSIFFIGRLKNHSSANSWPQGLHFELGRHHHHLCHHPSFFFLFHPHYHPTGPHLFCSFCLTSREP